MKEIYSEGMKEGNRRFEFLANELKISINRKERTVRYWAARDGIQFKNIKGKVEERNKFVQYETRK